MMDIGNFQGMQILTPSPKSRWAAVISVSNSFRLFAKNPQLSLWGRAPKCRLNSWKSCETRQKIAAHVPWLTPLIRPPEAPRTGSCMYSTVHIGDKKWFNSPRWSLVQNRIPLPSRLSRWFSNRKTNFPSGIAKSIWSVRIEKAILKTAVRWSTDCCLPRGILALCFEGANRRAGPQHHFPFPPQADAGLARSVSHRLVCPNRWFVERNGSTFARTGGDPPVLGLQLLSFSTPSAQQKLANCCGAFAAADILEIADVKKSFQLKRVCFKMRFKVCGFRFGNHE